MPLGAFKAALMGTAGVSAGADVVLLHDTDYSNASTASITSGIDSTYSKYLFKFYNIGPATNDVNFTFQVNATDGADYNDSNISSTYFKAVHTEDDSTTASLGYDTGADLAEAASFQFLGAGIGNGADESLAGELHLFNPSSTTYAKIFYGKTNHYGQQDASYNNFMGGYINDTTAIDDIQFKMSSGNFDGTIKMWGVK